MGLNGHCGSKPGARAVRLIKQAFALSMRRLADPMSEAKCAVHEERLQHIEGRLMRIEDDLDSIVSENRSMTTGLAVAERSFSLFQDIVTRLESRIEVLEKRIEAMLKDRWQVLAGLLANGVIGATSLATVIWLVDRFLEYAAK